MIDNERRNWRRDPAALMCLIGLVVGGVEVGLGAYGVLRPPQTFLPPVSEMPQLSEEQLQRIAEEQNGEVDVRVLNLLTRVRAANIEHSHVEIKEEIRESWRSVAKGLFLLIAFGMAYRRIRQNPGTW